MPGTFGDGVLYHQEILLRAREFDFDVRWDISFGNGLGDFDGDGDSDVLWQHPDGHDWTDSKYLTPELKALLKKK